MRGLGRSKLENVADVPQDVPRLDLVVGEGLGSSLVLGALPPTARHLGCSLGNLVSQRLEDLLDELRVPLLQLAVLELRIGDVLELD